MQSEREGGFQGGQASKAELFGAGAELASSGYLPSIAFLEEEDFQNFHEGMNAWIASDPANLLPKKESRDFADRHLKQLWRGWTTLNAPEIALAAFRSMNLKASVTKAKYAPDFRGYCKYIKSGMQGENGALTQLTIAQGKARTKVAGEQAVQHSRVKTQDTIGAKQEAAFDRSITRNEQKRIEAAGKSRAEQVSDEFRDKEIVTRVGGTEISGFLCEELRQKISGATRRQIEIALTHAASDLERKNLGSEVRFPDARKVMAVVEKRVLFEVYGKPTDEKRCGGPIAVFRKVKRWEHDTSGEDMKALSSWVCLAQAFVDRVAAQYPLTSKELYSIFRKLTDSFERWQTISSSEYPGLQAKIEAEFEAAAAEKHRENLAEAEREEARKRDGELGIERYSDRVVLNEKLASRVHKIAGDNAATFQWAWDDVKTRIYDRPADWIQERVIKLAKLLKDGTHNSLAARQAFPELFTEAA